MRKAHIYKHNIYLYLQAYIHIHIHIHIHQSSKSVSHHNQHIIHKLHYSEFATENCSISQLLWPLWQNGGIIPHLPPPHLSLTIIFVIFQLHPFSSQQPLLTAHWSLWPSQGTLTSLVLFIICSYSAPLLSFHSSPLSRRKLYAFPLPLFCSSPFFVF